jgi:hypothetical protein
MRTAVLLLLLAIVVVVVVIFFVTQDGKPVADGPEVLPHRVQPAHKPQAVKGGLHRVWPSSGQVDMGVAYGFNSGHCGLRHGTDFDGSFWEFVNETGNGGAKSNEDRGTITLVSDDLAVFESSMGRNVELHRLDGPFVPEGICF